MCFFCDDTYHPGHKCASQVYGLAILEEMGGEGRQEEDIEDRGVLLMQEEQPLISV